MTAAITTTPAFYECELCKPKPGFTIKDFNVWYAGFSAGLGVNGEMTKPQFLILKDVISKVRG